MWTVPNIRGKGRKDRASPRSDALANAIDKWAATVRGAGRVLRSLGHQRRLGDSVTTTAL
mgnify:CR=1 FL=1